MNRTGQRCFVGFIALGLTYIVVSGIILGLSPVLPASFIIENAEWVATSKSWLDRQVCDWFGLCGTMHLNRNGWTWDKSEDDIPVELPDFTDFWTSGEEDPDSWSDEEKRLREIPSYVFDHAPYVHLFSGEQYWPSDLAEHLVHTSPRLNYTLIEDMQTDRNLSNLAELNDLENGRHGRFIYMQSDDNVEENPAWLSSERGIPRGPDLRRKGTIGHIEASNDPDRTWPASDSVAEQSSPQQRITTAAQATPPLHEDISLFEPMKLVPSLDGRCGGSSGYTCARSRYGQCCSIYGWCGGSDDHCEDYCDPMHGDCTDLLDPLRNPKPDLRKRRIARDLPPKDDMPRSTELHKKPKTPDIGKSRAPAVLVVVDKGNGIIDAFWFFFYSFNLGRTVFNIRFGNHVGDWEHALVRFQNGTPTQVFLSEHNFGEAYDFRALEKYVPNPDGGGTMLGTFGNVTAGRSAKRPVIYSAHGTHAMYGTPGLHPYILPFGLLHDQTDRGPLWDPAQNVQAYTWDMNNMTVRASTRNPRSPTSWFDYAGHWGDKFYKLSDPRQYRFAGQYHYVNGPTGPRFKNLGRQEVCQGRRGVCRIKHWLGDGRKSRILPPEGEGDEEGGLPGGNYTDGAEPRRRL